MSHAPYIVQTAPHQWRVMVYDWTVRAWTDVRPPYRTRAEARAVLPWVRRCRVCGEAPAHCGGQHAGTPPQSERGTV